MLEEYHDSSDSDSDAADNTLLLLRDLQELMGPVINGASAGAQRSRVTVAFALHFETAEAAMP